MKKSLKILIAVVILLLVFIGFRYAAVLRATNGDFAAAIRIIQVNPLGGEEVTRSLQNGQLQNPAGGFTNIADLPIISDDFCPVCAQTTGAEEQPYGNYYQKKMPAQN